MLYNKGNMNRQHEFEADPFRIFIIQKFGLIRIYTEFVSANARIRPIKTTDLDISFYKKTFDLPEQAFKENAETEDYSDSMYSNSKIIR